VGRAVRPSSCPVAGDANARWLRGGAASTISSDITCRGNWRSFAPRWLTARVFRAFWTLRGAASHSALYTLQGCMPIFGVTAAKSLRSFSRRGRYDLCEKCGLAA
jgi:hypothetical protein